VSRSPALPVHRSERPIAEGDAHAVVHAARQAVAAAAVAVAAAVAIRVAGPFARRASAPCDADGAVLATPVSAAGHGWSATGAAASRRAGSTCAARAGGWQIEATLARARGEREREGPNSKIRDSSRMPSETMDGDPPAATSHSNRAECRNRTSSPGPARASFPRWRPSSAPRHDPASVPVGSVRSELSGGSRRSQAPRRWAEGRTESREYPPNPRKWPSLPLARGFSIAKVC
jgi:hypothetical protein